MTLPNTTTVSFDHDPLGRRVAKKINGTVTEKYLWSGLTQLLAVYDSSNNLVMRFEYADSRMPVSMTTSGETYYLTYDQVGSLRAVTDSSGTLVKQITYDTFGNIISDSNPTFTVPFGFAGGLHDRDAGLVRFGFRDYDPEVGRWTAKDPIGFNGGDIDLYGYVESDAVNWIDPYGLLTFFGGPSMSAGGGMGTGGKYDNYAGVESGGFITFADNCFNYGNYYTLSIGEIWGAEASAGGKIGFIKGDLSNFEGANTTGSFNFFFFSISTIYNSKGNLVGLSFSGGLGVGFGPSVTQEWTEISKKL